MQRIGESRWRPLELCYWPDQAALPAKGKEYPGLGYKRPQDKPPKSQEPPPPPQQQPAEAQLHSSGTMAVDDSDLADLLAFVNDKKTKREVRTQAVEILEGLAGSAEGAHRLKSNCSAVLSTLLRCLCDEDQTVARGVLSACVNLSQDPTFTQQMLQMRVISRAMDMLKENNCQHPQLLVMLLNNLTTSEEGSSELLQLGHDKMQGLNMAVLLKRFVVSGMMWDPAHPRDDYVHVGAILTNVTRLHAGRALLLQPGRGLLQVLAGQLKAPDLVRRQGAACALRNCCLAAEEDGTLDLICSDEPTVRALLDPLNGKSARGAEDAGVREALAECVMVLAGTERGRKALWAVKAPEIIKKGYELEEHPGVCRALEHAAALFLEHGIVDSDNSPQAEVATA
ncbi:hypothetical protein QJQ45_020358 [Haematococcus lacustris]|nr:hypothetical protein QJQ45_020358 [Haematococcus lacustris]